MNPTSWDHHDRDDDGRFNLGCRRQRQKTLESERKIAGICRGESSARQSNATNLTLDGGGDAAEGTYQFRDRCRLNDTRTISAMR